MSDDSIGSGDQRDATASRRAALKAGVGVGVGLVAWSGPTITSLGGTPAYAAGCTFVVQIDLSGGCRNTDQGNCAKPLAVNEFGYHTLKSTGLPSGFTLTNNVPEGTCCNQNHVATLNWNPSMNLTCDVKIRFNAPPQCTGASIGEISIPPESDGSLNITLSCPQVTSFPSSTQYTIVARCTTIGADPSCFN